MSIESEKRGSTASMMDALADDMSGTILITAAKQYAAAFEENPESEETKKCATTFLAIARECFPRQRTSSQRMISTVLGAAIRIFPEQFIKAKTKRAKRGRKGEKP